MTKVECIPCNRSQCLSCQQTIATTRSITTQAKQKFNVDHKVSFKSNVHVMYLLECLVSERQYVGKSGTPFHLRLNNYRKDIKSPHAIEACKHFNSWDHVFNKHGKIILIEQLNNIKNTSTEDLKQRLTDRTVG